MSFILAVLCSPRKLGITDLLAYNFILGARSSGAQTAICALREFRIAPCCACMSCMLPPHKCVLSDKSDDAEYIFSLINYSSLVVLFTPVYFYSLPAHFKALIDRSQQFWVTKEGSWNYYSSIKQTAPALIVISAGRLRGKLLFSGALRTLRWFLKILDRNVIRTYRLKGADLGISSPHIKKMAETLFIEGQRWGQIITSTNSGIEYHQAHVNQILQNHL